MVIDITKDNFQKEIENSNKPVVLDVYATWCGPCQHIAPIFEEISKELGDKYQFVKLNVDEARDIAVKYNVSSVPTIIFIKNNEIKGKEVGYMNKEDLKSKIEQALG